MIRDSSSPDRALRFSNLYSRLLTQPVLSQKWAILYLLHQLADYEHEEPPLDSAGVLPPRPSSQGGTTAQWSPTASEFHRRSNDGRVNGTPRLFPSDDVQRHAAHRLPLRTRAQPGSVRRDQRLGSSSINDDEEDYATPQEDDTIVVAPTEAMLLRDLPFILQGLSSTNLQFGSGNCLKLPPSLPPPVVSLLHTLAEPSLLYRGLSIFVQSSEGGLIAQSLRATIDGELRSYLELVGTLEGQIRRALASLDDGDYQNGLGKTGVTLKKCVVSTRDACMDLRLMTVMVEQSKGLSEYLRLPSFGLC